ncbi:MAG: hypothetical protein KKA28_19910 [Planctomycetes bacterium]|nr:hypothetical protein [Planctomycetota bacterium]MBU4478386.1 hypothetical protein [Candidatus Omnitrophota bacterium]
MKISWAKSFSKKYRALPKDIRERFDEKIQLFVENPSHASLRVKKMLGTENIWEASISKNYRWTFEWAKELVKLRHIGAHDILKRE